MYIIDLKDWMSNKGKYGYQKWANKKENKVNDDKKNVICHYVLECCNQDLRWWKK